MSDTIKAEANMRRGMPRLALLLLALVPIIANAFVAFNSLGELRDANARVGRALQAIVLLQRAEDLVVASGEDYYLYRLFGGEQRLGSYREALRNCRRCRRSCAGLLPRGLSSPPGWTDWRRSSSRTMRPWRHPWRRPTK